MSQIIKRVLLSVVLLVAATATLLVTDLRSRRGARSATASAQTPVAVAILKHASNPLLDDVERGVLRKLAAEGYQDRGRITLQRFCAESDLPTANAIAKRITDGSYKLVISISTLALQCVANANRDGHAIHVFGAVTDPAGAGVGIERMNSTNKPPWLAGIGTFQPVEQIFREAKQLWPGLRTVGVVWNPAERNSEACTLKARATCRDLGLELLEATVDQSKEVREAAESLIARGAQAFWTGADVTVLNATAALCESAAKARVPVFSNMSGHVRHGSLFDLGADYEEVGQKIGAIAAAILGGLNPATVVITNFMPERVMLNRQVLGRLRDPWRFTDSLVARAELIIGENGQTERDAGHSAGQGQSPASAGPAKPVIQRWRIHQICYSESPLVEDALRGFKAGLQEARLTEGADYTLKTLSAQGDMAALGSLFDSAQAAGTDLYVTYSTPTLQTALRKVRAEPVVFTVVADPFLAGAGRSDTDHQPNITGVYTQGPYREMAELLRDHFPQIKRVGTLFCPAEVNSVANKDAFVREATRCGVTVEGVPVNTATELSDAALALCGRRIDAVVQVVDNLTAGGFPTLARAAARSHLPVFTCQDAAARQGAALVLSRDYYEAGRDAASKAVRIMHGENPGQIPFSPPSRLKKFVNLKSAQECRLTIPEAFLREAQLINAEPSQP